MSQRTGILGGTFDPIHVGHLALAAAARRALHLDRVLVLPSHTPPHRSTGPAASSWHRFAMAAIAVADADGCAVSDLELEAGGFSYTWRTLERLHASGFAADALYFLTGADAFADIATWKHYPDVLAQAHFVVVSRAGQPAAGLRQHLPDLAARMIDVGPAGVPATDPSRPGMVIFLIDAATPDVSATAIRTRAAAGESLTGLVTPGVEAHIRRHRLYTTAAGRESRPAGRLHD
ncbi:MAG TPA: nicotinate-nucleotide adenylyltransferase [Vicinamibacterales bacterium]|nr:nicotinate-nucleotide adenylyltransferase [Vicinamibacterales bacterium]